MRDGLYKRPESENWYALIYIGGKRFRECTGTPSKREALKRRDELRAQLAEQLKDKAATGTWRAACVKWLRAADRSANDRYILRALEYVDRPLAQCTPESFESALEHLSNSTYNRYRAIIVAIGHLSGHDIKLPTKKPPVGRLRFLTREEWQTLYLALPEHLRPVCSFALATGLRQRNVTHLRWDQVDMAGRRMWVHADEAKGAKPIGIPLSTDAMAVLKGQEKKDGEWVFPYKGRGRSTEEKGPMVEIKTAWLKALERAGLGHFELAKDGDRMRRLWRGEFTFHGLRHTWASWHLMAGTPIETLAKLGGWADLRMVQRYAHLAPEHLAAFADNSKPWSRNSHTNQPQTA